METLPQVNNLQKYTLNYLTLNGAEYSKLKVSYQVFGPPLTTAPVVLVIHALTGNSDIASPEKGWWKELIGTAKVIDTQKYTVVAFNIPGNGYDGQFIENYKDFTARDIALIFHKTLSALGIEHLHAIIGGSLGGGIAWEMAALFPAYANYLIPIATDWKSTDWIIGHNAIQESILLNSKQPLQDARKMAMLFYRTPVSFTNRFKRRYTDEADVYKVASWLDYHGKKLEERFTIQAYLMMNHLLSTIDIGRGRNTIEEVLGAIQSEVIQIAVASDLFFIKAEILKTKDLLDKLTVRNTYHEIKSQDGHDAFLIEHEQLAEFLDQVFN